VVTAPAHQPSRAVALAGFDGHDARARYAFAALLDPLGMRLAAPGEPAAATVVADGSKQPGALSLRRGLLTEVFSALTLAHESETPLDEHGRPRPPDRAAAPLVSELAADLARALRTIDVETGARFADGERFAVALTHDVDALGTPRLRMAARKAVLGVALRPRSDDARRRRREARAYLADSGGRRDSAFPLESMLAAENGFGWSSTCFFLARHTHPLDGRGRPYLRHLRAAADAAAEAGLEIGLHASYRAREKEGAIAEEAELLAQLTGHQPRGMRHHYLRSAPRVLARELRHAGLEYDTSIGWATLPGARARTAYPYRLWDETTGAAGAWELPLFVMDGTLEREWCLNLDPDDAYEHAVAALEPVAAAGGACALLWHPPSHHPKLAGGYDVVYRRILRWIAEQGGLGASASDVLDRWRRRVPANAATPTLEASATAQ
jgi:peptidoglycan/xylan/chitin deacetylase (PgdA/CDA1 family)